MATERTDQTPNNHAANLLRQLDRYKCMEKLLTRVAIRLAISARGFNPKLDPLLADVLGLLRKVDSSTIQSDLERASDALFRTAMAELEKRKEEPETPQVQENIEPVRTEPPIDRYGLLFSFLKAHLGTSQEITTLNLLEKRAREGRYSSEPALFADLESTMEDILGSRTTAVETRPPEKMGILKRLLMKGGSTHDITVELVGLQKNLLALVEAVDVPVGLQAKANRLIERLKTQLDGDSLLDLLEQTVEFLASVKISAQQEQKFLEDFLSELTGKLVALEQQTFKVQDLHKATEADAEELHATFADHMDSLRSSARDATDLSALKSLLSQKLDHVTRFLNTEREQHLKHLREADEQMSHLTRRLKALEEETDELRSKLRVQHSLAMRDALTGLPNRMAYDERFHQEAVRCKRFGTPFCLLVWDVDHFKSINDRFGHKSGDKALMIIAEILANSIRETDFVGRFGGEEFVMLLAGARRADAARVAEEIRRKVEHSGFHSHSNPVALTISCGIAEFLVDETPDQTFERADEALYRAKREGRNRCVIAE